MSDTPKLRKVLETVILNYIMTHNMEKADQLKWWWDNFDKLNAHGIKRLAKILSKEIDIQFNKEEKVIFT